jgi:hypothetical protein
MTREELLHRLSDHEDNFIERKLDGVHDRDVRKTVVAFANSVTPEREGILFIGVADNGEIVGCVNPDDKQKKVRKACDDCFPAVRFVSEVLPVSGKSVVAIIVPFSSDKPHFSGPAYVRRGSESVVASNTAFDQLIYSRNSKLAAIQRYAGQIVTVISLAHKLGQARIVYDSGYRETAECRIIECDPHTVRLQNISTNEICSEAVDRIELTRDEEKYRPKLIVKGF